MTARKDAEKHQYPLVFPTKDNVILPKVYGNRSESCDRDVFVVI